MKDVSREQKIVKVSIVGIVTNVFLAVFKAMMGLLSGSIAIVMDAVNNLSDALSSVITIVGTKLAGKPADKKHPYGYGRIEHLSAMVIAAIVTAAGVSSLVESVKKIIHPSKPSYNYIILIIIAVAVVTKLLLGWYFKKKGEEVKSDSLTASGADASFDAIISLSTIVSAAIMMKTDFNIDGILGAIISLVIIKAGVEMFAAPLNQILGYRVDSNFSTSIKKAIGAIDGVEGVYDLTLHSYGPENMLGSVHIEIDEDLTAVDIHKLTKKIEKSIATEYGVFLTIGIYAKKKNIGKIQSEILGLIAQYKNVLQVHAFFIEEKDISFDIVVDFKEDDPIGLRDSLIKTIKERFGDYNIIINIDRDYAD